MGGPHHGSRKTKNINHDSQKINITKSRLNFLKITYHDKNWHLSRITKWKHPRLRRTKLTHQPPHLSSRKSCLWYENTIRSPWFSCNISYFFQYSSSLSFIFETYWSMLIYTWQHCFILFILKLAELCFNYIKFIINKMRILWIYLLKTKH